MNHTHATSLDHALAPAGESARYLFYTNECVGLGHLRRTTNLATAVIERDRSASALIITGSAVSPGDGTPERVDTIKLPVLSRDSEGAYASRRLGIDADTLQDLRARVAQASAEAFDPTVAVIDKAPGGLSDELIPTLETLRSAEGTKIVLGLRDIEDDPMAVRRSWRGTRMDDVIRRYYDAVLVYGPESSMDALDCMGWNDIGVPVHHVGYVGSAMPETGPADLPANYLLVTAGGGVDGHEVFASVLRALRLAPINVPVVMVTGPLMSDAHAGALVAEAAGLDVHMAGFRPDMQSVIAGARAVVSMAGYNTVSEVLRAGKPLLVVPRVRPSREQLVRAESLTDAGSATMLHPDDMTPLAMRKALDDVLLRDRPSIDVGLYDGASAAAEILGALAAQARLERHGIDLDDWPVMASAGTR